MRTNFQPDLPASVALIYKGVLGLLFGVCAGLAGYFIVIPVVKFYVGILLVLGACWIIGTIMQAGLDQYTWSESGFDRRKRLAAQKFIERVEND